MIGLIIIVLSIVLVLALACILSGHRLARDLLDLAAFVVLLGCLAVLASGILGGCAARLDPENALRHANRSER